MKVFELRDDFGLDHLTKAEREEPVPEDGEVLVEMKAVALNYRDLMVIRGAYNPRLEFPLVPCSDGVGVVREKGAEVSRFEIGERVMPIFSQEWILGPMTRAVHTSTLGSPLDGTLQQYRTFPAESLVSVPEYLDDVEAATLPCAGLTAWNALFKFRSLRKKEKVLVLGSGGVSIFALQFARTQGARVFATSSSPEKMEKLLEMGAEECVNYAEDETWGDTIHERTQGGVDHVIEIGGAGSLPQSMKAAALEGQLVLIGVLAGPAEELDLIPVLMKGLRVQGLLVGSREDFEAMNHWLKEHEVKPVIDRVFDFDETPSAFRYFADQEHFGKVCIQVA